MAKRFTDSEKFRDTWYRKLSPVHKCLWEYMLSECSHAGILELDYDAMSFHIGSVITEDDLKPFLSRLHFLNEEKIFIPSFVRFQQKELKNTNPAHKNIIIELEKYNIPVDLDFTGLERPLEAPLKGLDRGISNSKGKGKGNSKSNGKKAEKIKISLSELSIEHIQDWLIEKRVAGKYLTIDEHRLLEMFKDYCQSKNPKYKDYVAAFRNSFEWNNTPKVRSNNNERTQSTAHGLIEWMESGRAEENYHDGIAID